MKKIPDKSSTIKIVEVYEDNFIEEIKRIGTYLDNYNYIGMDTEFPGIVYILKNYSQDFYYKSLKLNVDSLKLIQLGITLCNEKGEYPKEVSTWQFNFKFDYKSHEIADPSFKMLCDSGIDFEKLRNRGISHHQFAEYFMISGLVLNPEVHWISFHGSYDFAYMLRLLLNCNLPDTDTEFTNILKDYFPSHYDIRILVQGKENLKGGLNKLAQYLEILRVGKTHQAGSDSEVTAEVFFKLIQSNFIDKDNLEINKNILFGIGEGADDSETLLYTKFNQNAGTLQNSSSNGNMFPSVQNYSYINISSNNVNGNNGNMMTMGSQNNKQSIPINMLYPPFQQFGYGYGMKMQMPPQMGNVTQNGNAIGIKKGNNNSLLIAYSN